MQRRSFLKTSAMAGSAFLFSRKLPSATTASDDALIEIMLDEPLGTISPLIYSHFTEELGAVIYDGVWVGENSRIANTGGIRRRSSRRCDRSKHRRFAGQAAALPTAMTGATASDRRTNVRGVPISGSMTRLEGSPQERITQLRP